MASTDCPLVRGRHNQATVTKCGDRSLIMSTGIMRRPHINPRCDASESIKNPLPPLDYHRSYTNAAFVGPFACEDAAAARFGCMI